MYEQLLMLLFGTATAIFGKTWITTHPYTSIAIGCGCIYFFKDLIKWCFFGFGIYTVYIFQTKGVLP